MTLLVQLNRDELECLVIVGFVNKDTKHTSPPKTHYRTREYDQKYLCLCIFLFLILSSWSLSKLCSRCQYLCFIIGQAVTVKCCYTLPNRRVLACQVQDLACVSLPNTRFGLCYLFWNGLSERRKVPKLEFDGCCSTTSYCKMSCTDLWIYWYFIAVWRFKCIVVLQLLVC